MQNLSMLPENLPVPEDDGACRHLFHHALPDCDLQSTQGGYVNLSKIARWLVLYCYPMTGRPGTPLPEGWDAIPGARGCTPQACMFRDHYRELQALNAEVFGLSTQSHADQVEAANRLHLPYALLSDAAFACTDMLGLPVFEVGGRRLNKRLTLIAKDGRIQHCFYPVFPPDRNSADVIDWLKKHGD
ncbi:Peroxiredoxin Bcp [Methylophilaceae bacterium]|nr:Peroxiredoxin Bcp [Methylophilaceae bacterium]